MMASLCWTSGILGLFCLTVHWTSLSESWYFSIAVGHLRCILCHSLFHYLFAYYSDLTLGWIYLVARRFLCEVWLMVLKCDEVFTRGQFWPSGIVIALSVYLSVCVYQSLACPHDNLSAVQARITKFETQVKNTLVKIPITLKGDWLWTSRSNLTWKSNFTSFWACPHDNLSLV